MRTASHASALLFLLLGASLPGLGQTDSPADTVQAGGLYEKALDLQNAAQYDSAITLFDAARTVYTQLKRTADRVRCMNGKAVCLRLKGQYDRAHDAMRIHPEEQLVLLNEAPLVEAQRLATIGSIYLKQAKFDSALVAARQALATQRSNSIQDRNLSWDTYSLLASVHRERGDHDSALAYNQHSIDLFPDPRGEEQAKVANSYNSIALIRESRGEYPKALAFYHRSLDLYRAIRGEKHPGVATLYNNIAAVHMRVGDHDLALEYYLKAFSIMKETLADDHPNVGLWYNNVAMVYRSKGEFAGALDAGKKSKDIFVKKLGPGHPNVAGVVNNIGRTYADMGENKRALEAYHEAFAIWKEKLGEQHPYVTQSCFNIGEMYGRLGDGENAEKWLGQSLSVRRDIMGEKNTKVAQSYNALGVEHARKGEIATSLQYHQKALIALVEGFDDTSVYANPASFNTASRLDLLESLSAKAETMEKQYTKAGDLKDLSASFAAYEQAALLVESIRHDLSAEGSKILFGRNVFRVYEGGMGVAHRLFTLTRDETYKTAAFTFSERSKAGVLWEAIAESHAKAFAGIPDSVLNYEGLLRAGLAHLETQRQKEQEQGRHADAQKIRQLQDAVFDTRRRYAALIEHLETTYPTYHALKYQTGIVSLGDVRNQLLNDTTALLEYVVGDSASYAILVTTKQCDVFVLPGRQSMETRVLAFRHSLRSLDFREYARSALSLYRTLLHPGKSTLAGVKKLHIIPDGVLNYLPFDALLTKRVGDPTRGFDTFPYVLRNHEIVYHPSATLLVRSGGQAPVRPEGFTGFAPVFADSSTPRVEGKNMKGADPLAALTRAVKREGVTYPALPESEHEVRGITRLFHMKGQSAHAELHATATESVFKASGSRSSRYLHIASHGLINEREPGLSGILFAREQSEGGEDGVLYAGEVYNLELDADMVVLSACESGLGKDARGEGVLGLTRGFLYAGARNLVVSLWQVADKSTADLMLEFYDNVLKGQTYSTALRNAKLAMIKRVKYSYPLEWGPFVLVGR